MDEILTPDRIMQVWGWCQSAFLEHGHKLSFPPLTDPRKTYQWRHARRLATQLAEWHFDDQTAQVYLGLAAGYIKSKKLLHKGLSAFFQSNMLQLCHTKMEERIRFDEERIKSIDAAHRFLRSKCGDVPTERVLLRRESFDSFRNIVVWHGSSNLPAVYMAVSRPCMIAINALEEKLPQERVLLPSKAALFSLMTTISEDVHLRTNVRSILGDDWRSLCAR